MTSAHTLTVCVTCRVVTQGAIHCDHTLTTVGPNWRASRRTNDRAWKRIEAGDWLWDHDALGRRPKWTRQAWLAAQDTPRHLLKTWNTQRAQARRRLGGLFYG